MSKFDLIKKIPELKKEKEWLKEVNSQSLQAVLNNQETAYINFFKKQSDFPKFKKKNSKQSFSCTQSTEVDFENGLVFIPKFKKGIKTKFHRTFEGSIRSSTVKMTPSGQYFISILVEDGKELPSKPEIKSETTIGLDLGIIDFAVLSDGTKFKNPKNLKKSQQKIKKLQRRLSRCKKGSKRREKAKIRLVKAHQKVANQRKDFHHKLSYRLTHDNQVDTIVMETLSTQNMMKNHKLAGAIGDCGWFQFLTMLRYKCDWYGKNLVQIGRFEPSSKRCSCGHIHKSLTLRDRIWTCPNCGSKHDRDINAAKNIKFLGLEQTSKLAEHEKNGFLKRESDSFDEARSP
jgi:putative transposase